jgi:aspartate aminotransferase-like enzyme
MQRQVEAWVGGRGGELGYAFLPEPDRRSWTVSCLRVPHGMSGRSIVRAMKGRGWVIGSGYGPLKEETVRIGHMGDHTPERLSELLTTLEEVTAA